MPDDPLGEAGSPAAIYIAPISFQGMGSVRRSEFSENSVINTVIEEK